MEKRMRKLTHWLVRVATAAPAIPIFSTKMKMGSRIMFRMPPAVRPIMDRAARPWERSRLFSTKELHITGAPSRM